MFDTINELINNNNFFQQKANNFSVNSFFKNYLTNQTSIDLIEIVENLSGENSSLNNNNKIYVPYNKRPETYIVPIIFSIIFFLGLIGNVLLIYAYFNQKSLRTIPNTYIISLSFGDLLTICSAMPFVSTIYTVESWHYSVFVCKLSELTRDLSTGVSVYTLAILSFDRYVAIVCPLQRYASASKRRRTTIINTICIWAGSLIIALPGFINSYLKRINISSSKKIEVCYPFPKELGIAYAKFIVLTKFLALYFIPLVIIKIFYLDMARNLLRSSRSFKHCKMSDAHLRHMRSRSKVAKIVLIFIVMFAICFFPSHFFLLWFYFYPNAFQLYNNFWHYLKISGFVLSFTNSCLNPIALCLISRTFRQQFKHYLCNCFCFYRVLIRVFCCKKIQNQPDSQQDSANRSNNHQQTTVLPYLTELAFEEIHQSNTLSSGKLFYNGQIIKKV